MGQDEYVVAVGAEQQAASTSAPARRAGMRRWVVAVILMALVITGYFDRISVAVLFTNHDFQTAMGTGFNPALLGMLMTAFFFTYGIASVFLGFTGDRFGPRRMLISASFIWGGLMFVMGAASSYVTMLISRIALGITEGPQFGWITKVVLGWFPETERGRANAIWLVGSPLGSAIGFPVIIGLVAAYGWRNAFFVLGALSIFVMLPLLALFVTAPPNELAQARGDVSKPTSKSFWQNCESFLKSRDFWLLTIFDCGELIYLWGLNSWLPTYLQTVRHFDIQHLGFYSSLPFVMSFLCELISGFLSDRFEKKAPLVFLGMVGAAILLYVATIVPDSQVAALTIAVSSGCFGLTVPATYTLMQRIIPKEVASSGVGVLNGIANTVGALAPFVMGVVIAANNNDFTAGLLVLVVSCLVCSCAILPIVKRL